MKRVLKPILLLSALCLAPLSHAACEKEINKGCALTNQKADACMFEDPALEIKGAFMSSGANGYKAELGRLIEMHQKQYDDDAPIAKGEMMMAMQDYKLCVINALKAERDKH